MIDKKKWPDLLTVICILFSIVLVAAGVRVIKLDRQIDAIRATYDKQIGDLQAVVNEQTAALTDCHKTILGDGTKTLLMDANHPYGKFVSPAADLPPGYVPGPVWIVPRRIVPRTMDGTLNGAYAYLHADGTLEPWHLIGEQKQ